MAIAKESVGDIYSLFKDSFKDMLQAKHITQMKEAVKDGVELLGYTTWRCIDLISAVHQK